MSHITLDSPVSQLAGIGPAAEEKLARLDINTVYDLISFLPRRYNDWSNIDNLDLLFDGQEISFKGVVQTKPQMNPRSRVKPINFFVSDGNRKIKLTFFNSPYLLNKFMPGDEIFVHGKVTMYNHILNIVNPFVEKQEKVDSMNLVRPVYHMTKGINSNQLQKWIKSALDLCADQIPDIIPVSISKRYGFCSVKESYYKVHFPDSPAEAEEGRRRIAFEELILIGVGMKLFLGKTEKEERARRVIPPDAKLADDIKKRWKDIMDNLGFELTADQKKAVNEIQRDLMKAVPMNRLVQGDVGSGKTAVAILSCAMTALMGKQSVLLAPTSVLAKQHYDNAAALLKGSGINVALLLGKTKASLKREIKEQLKNNEASVIIGTHALLTDDVQFSDLALVIADEQHRFGVKQREKLLMSGNGEDGINAVHNLVMTATPIPRTLAMVLYGDMDTSVIKQKPSGRKPVKTFFASSKDSDDIYKSITAKLDAGEQVYIVCAKVDDEMDEIYNDSQYGSGDEAKITSVTRMAEILKEKGIADKYKTGVLYGPMPEKKKLETMERFLSGEIKILVSTTVIEVGVDNPNANLMVIMDADRFGLSTLHQLRGRVGRGDKPSYCILVSESRSELALTRMNMMVMSSDGFELASKDLELRGPGDFFGTRQHGIPSLRAANLYTDLELAKEATDAVNEVFRKDPKEALLLKENIVRLFDLRFKGKIGAM